MNEKLQKVNAVNVICAQAEADILAQTGLHMRVIVTSDQQGTTKGPEGMMGIIANALGMTADAYKNPTRKREVVEVRQLACYFLSQYYPEMSLGRIGLLVANYDHTTVMHSKQVVTKNLKNDDFQKKYDNVLNAVSQWIRE
jgi:chromosomal replication initiation ATPase DnaA